MGPVGTSILWDGIEVTLSMKSQLHEDLDCTLIIRLFIYTICLFNSLFYIYLFFISYLLICIFFACCFCAVESLRVAMLYFFLDFFSFLSLYNYHDLRRHRTSPLDCLVTVFSILLCLFACGVAVKFSLFF